MIDRKALVYRHNPLLREINTKSPLTVGNGDFAFTADITGFQSLYNEYKEFPLCTMSNWGWHTEPVKNGRGFYFPEDAEFTRYESHKGYVEYPSEETDSNKDAYNWLRRNPHRLNLGRIALLWNGKEINPHDITCIRQELELYTGVLHSKFKICGYDVYVQTVCATSADVIGFSVSSSDLPENMLSVSVSFPYGSHKINASDWESTEHHESYILSSGFKHSLDDTVYYIGINGSADIREAEQHKFVLNGRGREIFEFSVSFSEKEKYTSLLFSEVKRESEEGWEHFWQNGGIADFSGCEDKRANELERRMILSMYLTAVNCSGRIPPQETGLSCNSWYGKFHLEMHILHSGWFPLWGRSKLLEKSFDWYEAVLENAGKNAARNGYSGARWVKMTGPEGINSPSRIAVFLIWQQPHILYMLELVRRTKKGAERAEFMRKYLSIVKLTAEFMCDFTCYNEERGCYELMPPLIPAQEEFPPETVLNPTFELCYWRYGLEIAVNWVKELGEEFYKAEEIGKRLAKPAVYGGVYAAHQNCTDTFEKYNRDHPSMLFGYGFIPYKDIDREVMSRTVDKVLKEWNFASAWGWDFALTAMTLSRLGRAEDAVDILLYDTPKNKYAENGNNYQFGRTDLPLYLPGNGSLLFALSLMLAGYGDKKGVVGFPENGQWNVKTEGISGLYDL